MLINDQSLRNFIRVILAEGIEEDFRTLLSNNPESAGALLSIEGITDPGTKRKIKSWLVANFMGGDLVSTQETIGTLKEYADNVKSIVSSYVDPANVDFKESVDGILSAKVWTNPGDIPRMTFEDFRVILEEYKKFKELKKQRVKIDRQSSAWLKDKIGETANWNVWFPSNRDNSINIYENNGGKEAHDACMRASINPYKEQWCTSRTDMENLFNSYAAQGRMLYYVTKKKPTAGPYDLLSIQISADNSEEIPRIVKGENAGMTVDVAQRGLSEEDIQNILGAEFANVRDMMTAHFERIGGKHPVGRDLLTAVKDYDRWVIFTKGNSLFTRLDLLSYAEQEFAEINANNKSDKIKDRHYISEEIRDELGREVLVSIVNRVKEPGVTMKIIQQLFREAARLISHGKAKRLTADVLAKVAPSLFTGDIRAPGLFQKSLEKRFARAEMPSLENAYDKFIASKFMLFLERDSIGLRSYITTLMGENRGWWDAPSMGIKFQILSAESDRERAGNSLVARLKRRAMRNQS